MTFIQFVKEQTERDAVAFDNPLVKIQKLQKILKQWNRKQKLRN